MWKNLLKVLLLFLVFLVFSSIAQDPKTEKQKKKQEKKDAKQYPQNVTDTATYSVESTVDPLLLEQKEINAKLDSLLKEKSKK